MCKVPSTFAGCCGSRAISLSTGLSLFFGFVVARGFVMTVNMSESYYDHDQTYYYYYKTIVIPQAVMNIILGVNGIISLQRRDPYMLKTSYLALKMLLLITFLVDVISVTYFIIQSQIYDQLFWGKLMIEAGVIILYYTFAYLMLGTLKSTIAVLKVGGTGREHKSAPQIRAQETQQEQKFEAEAFAV